MERTSIVPPERSVSSDLSRRPRPDSGFRSGPYRTRLPQEVTMRDFLPARQHIEVSSGDSLRILRELQELSQNELAERSGIPQGTISAIENGRVRLGVERAKTLARALRCHPAVLVFPSWGTVEEAVGGPSGPTSGPT